MHISSPENEFNEAELARVQVILENSLIEPIENNDPMFKRMKRQNNFRIWLDKSSLCQNYKLRRCLFFDEMIFKHQNNTYHIPWMNLCMILEIFLVDSLPDLAKDNIIFTGIDNNINSFFKRFTECMFEQINHQGHYIKIYELVCELYDMILTFTNDGSIQNKALDYIKQMICTKIINLMVSDGIVLISRHIQSMRKIIEHVDSRSQDECFMSRILNFIEYNEHDLIFNKTYYNGIIPYIRQRLIEKQSNEILEDLMALIKCGDKNISKWKYLREKNCTIFDKIFNNIISDFQKNSIARGCHEISYDELRTIESAIFNDNLQNCNSSFVAVNYNKKF